MGPRRGAGALEFRESGIGNLESEIGNRESRIGDRQIGAQMRNRMGMRGIQAAERAAAGGSVRRR
ncbi:hypothetical protein F7Q96_19135 [Cupriavidus gilardii]|nr:hypothetical protein F7Q96_19135 [Cupriavidus gilardii]